jgi:hypothetical protein
LPLTRIILAMRKRKNRSFLKHYFVRTVPRSSILNKIASNFKQCCFNLCNYNIFLTIHLHILSHVST